MPPVRQPTISSSVVCPPGVNPRPDYVDYLIPGHDIEEFSKIAGSRRAQPGESRVTLPAAAQTTRDPCLSTQPPEGACEPYLDRWTFDQGTVTLLYIFFAFNDKFRMTFSLL